jgi:hypothetical protein
MTVGIGFFGFTYKLNADKSYIKDMADFIIPNLDGIVHTLIDVIAITQEPYTSHYGFRSTNSIAD